MLRVQRSDTALRSIPWRQQVSDSSWAGWAVSNPAASVCRCAFERGAEDPRCTFYKNAYESLCPPDWVSSPVCSIAKPPSTSPLAMSMLDGVGANRHSKCAKALQPMHLCAWVLLPCKYGCQQDLATSQDVAYHLISV